MLLALVAAPVLSGCGGNKHVITLDNRFSMNVVKVPAWFPDEKMQLSAAETEVLSRYGRPDFIRFWWNQDGSLITSSDLSGKSDQLPDMMVSTERSWIFMTEDKEIRFVNNGKSYREQPIESTIKLVCTYGDPSTCSKPIYRNGVRKETWQWIEHGIIVELIDGQEVNRKYFQGTGAGTWAAK